MNTKSSNYKNGSSKASNGLAGWVATQLKRLITPKNKAYNHPNGEAQNQAEGKQAYAHDIHNRFHML